MNKNIFIIPAIVSFLALLCACSDDDSSNSIVSESASCSVKDNEDNSYTISCADGTTVTVRDGQNGADGADGKDGTDGEDGKDGTNGVNGTNGKDGVDGEDGKDGVNGSDGKDGTDGVDGTDGKDGVDGSETPSTDVEDVSSLTSCTVKKNENSSYTITCPDGTTATVAGAVSGSGTTTSIQNTAIYQYSFDYGYRTEQSVYIYDYQKMYQDAEGDIVVKLYSTSDSEGITLIAETGSKMGVYPYAAFFITPGESHDNYLHAGDGDSVYAVYVGGVGTKQDTLRFYWKAEPLPIEPQLSVERSLYAGDSAKVSVTLTNSELKESSVIVSMRIASNNYRVTLNGGSGYYSRIVTLTSSKGDPSKGIYPVTDSTLVEFSYTGADEVTISATTKWLAKSRGDLHFGRDKDSFSTTGSYYVYLYDLDNAKKTQTVVVKNLKTNDSVLVDLKRQVDGYYEGRVNMSYAPKIDYLLVRDTTYISAYYYDESTKETITDRILIQPYKTNYVNLRIDDNKYYGLQDKIVLDFNSYCFEYGDAVEFTVTSDSDPVGYIHESVYLNSNTLGNGTVGFTTGKSGMGFIHVESGDMVYISYTKPNGDVDIEKAVWYPEEGASK